MSINRMFSPARAGRMALLCLPFVLAGAAHATGLSHSLQAALDNNAQMNAARAELGAAAAKVDAADGGYYPQVDLTASAGKTKMENLEFGAPFGLPDHVDLTPRQVALEVMQPLYTAGGLSGRSDSAGKAYAAQRARYQGTAQNVLLAAAQAYLDLYRARATLDLAQHNEALIKRQLQAVRLSHEKGERTGTDVSLAEARYAGARARTSAAQGDVRSAEAQYEQVTGEPAPKKLDPPPQIPGLPGDVAAATRAAANNFPVMAAQYAAQAARAQQHVAESKSGPQLALTAKVAHLQEPDFLFKNEDVASINLEFKMPLFHGGSLDAEARAAQHEAVRREAMVDDARRQSRSHAIQAFAHYQSALAQLDAIGSQVDAAQRALDGVQAEAHEGERTILDVLDADQDLLDAQVSQVEARSNLTLSALTLKAAMGELAPAYRVTVPEANHD